MTDDPFVEIGRTPLNVAVNVGIRAGLLGLIQGQSGSGKSVLGNNLVVGLIQRLRDEIQIAVIDPKRVSFNWLTPRAHVYTNETDWLTLLQSFVSEMDRRYAHMEEHGLETFPISPEQPFLLLVIEEMSAVTNNQRLLKKEREQLQTLLIDYSNRCRQCAMGLLIICQSCDSNTMPTVIRSNCSTRFALKTSGQEQVKMIAQGREEECPCGLLTLPGQFYALTSETNGRWVKGRTKLTTLEERKSIIQRYATDKRTPYCLKWDSDKFLG